MKIFGCGNDAHSPFWVDITNGSCLVNFCPKCGKPLDYMAPKESAPVKVKIQVHHSPSYGDTAYSVYASYGEDDKMLFVGDEFSSPDWAVKSAKEKATNYHFRGTRFEWEVWLDVPVTNRRNDRMPEYEGE